MTRKTTVTTLNQLSIAPGGLVLYGLTAGVPHIEPDVCEQLNWSVDRRPQVYLSTPTYWAGGASGGVRQLGLRFTGSATYVEKMHFQAKIDDDCQQLTFGVVASFVPGDTGRARIVIGGNIFTSPVLNNANSNTLVTTALVPPTGWQDCTILLRNDGATLNNILLWVVLMESGYSVPAPLNA